MKTQSPDTSLDAELALIGMLRKAGSTKRFALVDGWTASMLLAGSEYIRQLQPQTSDEEARLIFIERQYGKAIVDKVRLLLARYGIDVEGRPSYRQALQPLVKICKALDVPYALCGSLAGSLYGMQRATLQIDILAGLASVHLCAFYDSLAELYLVAKEEMEEAILNQTSFCLVHLGTLFKIVVTVQDQKRFAHLREIVLVQGEDPVFVLGPEEVVSRLLEAFQKNNERDDDLWYDLLGVLKVQGKDLDLVLLNAQAAKVETNKLLERALFDAGLK